MSAGGGGSALLAACGSAGSSTTSARSLSASANTTTSPFSAPIQSASTSTASPAPANSATTTAPAESLSGTFELLSQDWAPINSIHKDAIALFAQQYPQVKMTYTTAGYGPEKIKASIAAGAGPDAFFHYTGYWRGVDAANIMLQLTPQVFQPGQLTARFYPNLLHAVYAKNQEVYFLPVLVGIGAGCTIYNPPLLASLNVDPQSFTTLDGILGAANKLVVRNGPTITRAGMLFGHTTTLVYRWILDQGGKFYDEQTHQWNWQTAEAERAMQWLADAYLKEQVAWTKPPAGVKDPLAEGRDGILVEGPYALSGYAASYPKVEIKDQPMPGFVPKKDPIYYEPELAGYSLSALLKGQEMKIRIGAAFLDQLLSPNGVIGIADQYSGAILVNGLYSETRFQQTKFGAVRAWMPQMISRLVLVNTGADPGFDTQLNKVLAGQMSIQAALAEMQQIYSAKEEQAQRAMT
jgi:hypothetical protein